MLVLGIDCGTERTGFGVIDSDGRRHTEVAHGVIRTNPANPLADRLVVIRNGLRDVLGTHAVGAVSVETVFAAKNVQSALKLAHVRGVALLVAREEGVAIAEYSPLEIKQSVTGYGRATKPQVQDMVARLLGMAEPPKSFDAADALAAAICHAVTVRL